MKRFWKKQLPAFLLALILMVGMMPAALAQSPCSHSNKTITTTTPTCTTDGVITTTCNDCHLSWTSSNGTKLGHEFGAWAVSPSDSNSHIRTCQRNCGVSETATHRTGNQYESSASGHWLVCLDCGAHGSFYSHSYTQKKDATGHWNECACGVKLEVGAHIDLTPQDGKCDTCGYSVHVHNYSSSWSRNTATHWHQCSCMAKADEAAHTDVDQNGSCDVCSYMMGFSYTVAFQTLSGTTTQSVQQNNYPTTPSNPIPYTLNGKTYIFKGWTTTNAGDSWYLYSVQPLVTPSTYRITGATTFYAVYEQQINNKITYTVVPGEEEPFDADDFNEVYQDVEDTTRDIAWVEFSVTSSAYNGFEGYVYCGSSALTRSQLNGSKFYYKDSSDGDYALDDLYLMAPKGADNDTLTLEFIAHRTSSSYAEGTLELVVDEDSVDADTIVYKVDPGKTVDFDREDFNKVFQEAYSNYTVSYVVFDRPDTAAFADGTLYCDYGRSYQTEFTRNTLDDAYFYYNSSFATEDDEYDLDELTFAAGRDFAETVKLTFTAYGTGTRSVEGVVEIRPSETEEENEITYEVSPDKTVDFDRGDFNALFRKTYSSGTVSYVVFDRPSSLAFADGTLYSDYDGDDEISFTRSNLSSAKFYYDEDDISKAGEYDLDNLTFAADGDFADTVKLAFAAYDINGRYVTGTVVIEADQATAPATSSYVGNIRYAVAAGTNVQINANDIARFFKSVYPADSLQFVLFSGVPATGSLYYNYYGASAYGTTARAQITASNCSGQVFYPSPASTSDFALTELTYVPSGSNYCVSIPFTAYGSVTSRSVSGVILISVSRSAVSEVYGVTPANTAVNFPASSIYSAVFNATGTALHSIQLLSLPASSVGTVYRGAGTSVLADSTTQYTYASGTNSISQLRFVPAAGYTGSVELPYVAFNSSGAAIASGIFSLGVVNSRKSFSDVTSSTWCYKYVTELSAASVIDGYTDGSFKPNNTISYGAALKLIMLAAGYPEQAPTSSNVFSGYLEKARADGLVTRSNINLTGSITRLQVAQLAAAALKLDTSRLSSVKPFNDTADPYVQALNAAGIVEGYFSNGVSSYRPNNTLTRGQVSAIVWRMNNYRK